VRLAFLSIGRHIHTERWIRWFVERGHETHLLTVQPGPLPGVEVHDIRASLGPKPLRYAFSLLEVKRLLRHLQPDLLNTHFLTGYGYWGRFSGFHPNLLTVWGDDVYVTPHENRLKRWLAAQALRGCDALTGDSADILQAAVQLGANPRRAYRVLWGVDLKRFIPSASSDAAIAAAAVWRRERGISKDEILYFSPRSFTQPYYNIDVVIAAAARVQAREPRARFLFSGYEGDPEPFWERARQAGIAATARFLGRIPHAEFATALQACDVFISVPSVDATAVSLLEAMACGCAIIVSTLPSALEWITPDLSGLAVPARNVDALAAAMLRLAAAPAARTSLGAAARVVALEHAGFDHNMEIVDALLRRLITGRGAWPESAALPGLEDQARHSKVATA
jgi:glycosyltransferase involved in cell wall biosynthesis